MPRLRSSVGPRLRSGQKCAPRTIAFRNRTGKVVLTLSISNSELPSIGDKLLQDVLAHLLGHVAASWARSLRLEHLYGETVACHAPGRIPTQESSTDIPTKPRRALLSLHGLTAILESGRR